MNALTRPNRAAALQPLGASLIPQNMDQAMRMAEMMARSKLLPEHLRNPSDALLVIEQAMRWQMSPFAVGQATAMVKGRLFFEGKLVAAALHSSGALRTRLDYAYRGAGADRTVTVSAVLAGEDAPRTVDVRHADAATDNAHWRKSPDQMLAYHGARVWARRYAPEVMLGVYSPEEFDEGQVPADTYAGVTVEAQAEPAQVAAPATSPAPAEALTAAKATPEEKADRLLARINAAAREDHLHAISGDPNVAKGRAWFAANRPDLDAKISAAFTEAFARLTSPTTDQGDDGNSFDPDDGFPVDLLPKQPAPAEAAS